MPQEPENNPLQKPEGADQRPPLRSSAYRNSTLLMCIIALFAGYFLSDHMKGLLRRKSGSAVRDFETMNTFARIQIPEGNGSDRSADELADLAVQAVSRVNTLMSPVGEGSDVYRLNNLPAHEWLEADPMTWTVVMEALRWHRLSGGAFDPTIGPLKRLFIFDQREIDALPPSGVLDAARARVGADKLLYRREGMRLAWEQDGMRLDLGAIAKGFAADAAAEVLLRNGVKNALVDIGGELRVLGMKPGDPATPWRAGIKNPRGNDIVERLSLTDAAVATSGDYERFFLFDGKCYEHIIDPRTGFPVSDGIAGVTVIHPDSCLAADALATTMCVLGVEEGKAFLESNAMGLFSRGVRVIIMEALDNGLRRVEYVVEPGGAVTEHIGLIKTGTTK